jgi:hypothetical protein
VILWVHETTLTTKSEAATCYKKSRAAAFSKDSVSELFNLLERTVEHKVNCTVIYVYNVKWCCNNILGKKTGKKDNGEM